MTIIIVIIHRYAYKLLGGVAGSTINRTAHISVMYANYRRNVIDNMRGLVACRYIGYIRRGGDGPRTLYYYYHYY